MGLILTRLRPVEPVEFFTRFNSGTVRDRVFACNNEKIFGRLPRKKVPVRLKNIRPGSVSFCDPQRNRS